ncbi:hypothetical protein IWQ60_008644 [Tieghemiomyces parasiticus]|uniref:Uncharacterized protein n=1 Tax=Tieghemiomyces parasiticus TaxID=78921 RepID=A0A9W7ZR53_9FUNG|nr:hypothetical protein IWQ60_008644 [Tieghemiomyces parasiticus]
MTYTANTVNPRERYRVYKRILNAYAANSNGRVTRLRSSDSNDWPIDDTGVLVGFFICRHSRMIEFTVRYVSKFSMDEVHDLVECTSARSKSVAYYYIKGHGWHSAFDKEMMFVVDTERMLERHILA